ncbi:hypothetical protein ES702_00889 [subsurface metagenome]
MGIVCIKVSGTFLKPDMVKEARRALSEIHEEFGPTPMICVIGAGDQITGRMEEELEKQGEEYTPCFIGGKHLREARWLAERDLRVAAYETLKHNAEQLRAMLDEMGIQATVVIPAHEITYHAPDGEEVTDIAHSNADDWIEALLRNGLCRAIRILTEASRRTKKRNEFTDLAATYGEQEDRPQLIDIKVIAVKSTASS